MDYAGLTITYILIDDKDISISRAWSLNICTQAHTFHKSHWYNLQNALRICCKNYQLYNPFIKKFRIVVLQNLCYIYRSVTGFHFLLNKSCCPTHFYITRILWWRNEEWYYIFFSLCVVVNHAMIWYQFCASIWNEKFIFRLVQ